MWKKFFVFLLIGSVIVVGSVMFMSHSWLQSLTNPRDVVANYEFYANWARNLLFLSSLILFLVANAVLFSNRRSWALWSTFLFFSMFALAQFWWMDGNFFAFKRTNNLTNGETSLTGIAAVLACLIAGAIAFFDQIIVVRMRDRIYGRKVLNPTSAEDEMEPVAKN